MYETDMKFYRTLFTELQHRNPPPPPSTLRTGQGSSLNTRRVALGTAQPPVRADSEHYYYASVISLHDSCFPSLSSYLCFFQRCRLIPLALAPLWFSLNALPSPNDELQHDTHRSSAGSDVSSLWPSLTPPRFTPTFSIKLHQSKPALLQSALSTIIRLSCS